MDPGESYTLCVDGDSPGSGLDISATSTLRDVRENFPVPSQFFFAVPPAGEGALLASAFVPLVLLNGSEVEAARVAILGRWRQRIAGQ